MFCASDSSNPIIGPSGEWINSDYFLNTAKPGEATLAEVLGDMDGFNIGLRILNDFQRKTPLSEHIDDYYKNGNRFSEFESNFFYRYNMLKDQVNSFSFWFSNYKNQYKNTTCEYKFSKTIVERAMNAFCTSFSSRFKKFGCPR